MEYNRIAYLDDLFNYLIKESSDNNEIKNLNIAEMEIANCRHEMGMIISSDSIKKLWTEFAQMLGLTGADLILTDPDYLLRTIKHLSVLLSEDEQEGKNLYKLFSRTFILFIFNNCNIEKTFDHPMLQDQFPSFLNALKRRMKNP